LVEFEERAKALQIEVEDLKGTLKKLQVDVKEKMEETEEIKEQNWNLTRKIETSSCNQEMERVRVVELTEENKALKNQMKAIENANLKTVNETNSQITTWKDRFRVLEESNLFVESEFAAYQEKVVRVLNDQNANSNIMQ